MCIYASCSTLFTLFYKTCLPEKKLPAFLADDEFSKFIVFVSLSVGILTRIDFWWVNTLWTDTFSLKAGLVTHSLWQLIKQGPGFDQSAPVGFLILSKIVGVLTNYDNHALALFPLVAGITSIFILHKLLRLLGGSRAIGIMTILIALNPAFIYYSGEFKQYSVDVACCAIVVYATAFFILRRQKILWVFLSFVIAPLFSHAAFLVIPAAGFSLFISENSRQKGQRCYLGTICAIGTVTLLVMSAVAFNTLQTMPSMMDDYWGTQMQAFAPVSSSKNAILWYATTTARIFRCPTYLTYVPYASSGLQMALSLFPLGMLIFGMLKTYKLNRYVFATLLLPIFFCIAASAFHHWPIAPGDLRARLILFFPVLLYPLFAEALEPLFSYVWIKRLSTAVILVSMTLYTFFSDLAPHFITAPILHEIAHLQDPDNSLILCDEYSRRILISCKYALPAPQVEFSRIPDDFGSERWVISKKPQQYIYLMLSTATPTPDIDARVVKIQQTSHLALYKMRHMNTDGLSEAGE